MMKAKIRKHYLVPQKTTARKIVSVVVFAMFLNILNLGIFAGFNSPLKAAGSVMELENEFGRICSVVNLPVKIVNDLLKKERLTPADGSGEENDGRKHFAFFVPAKQAKKSGTLALTDAIVPNFQNNGKTMPKWAGAYPAGHLSLQRQYSVTHYYVCNGAVMCMLLLLMIMLVLPRGIPEKIKNCINKYKFCISRLYFK